MDDLDLLNSQIDALKDRIRWTKQVLDLTQKVDPILYEKLGVRFAELVKVQEKDINDLINALSDRTKIRKNWNKFSKINSECSSLFGEVLAFHVGLFMRQSEMEENIYSIADGLCGYLSHQSQVKKTILTVPGTEDTFTGMTNLIRMRFPDFSIWSLPVVAHEFGHYLEANERKNIIAQLFHRIVEEENTVDQKSEQIPILKEQFSDLFATYALGPAYACMCVFLEFNPYQAHQTQKDHPTYAERVYFILGILRKMDEGGGTNRMKSIINELEQTWFDNQNPIIKNPDLDRRTEMMFDFINEPKTMLGGVRYLPGSQENELTKIIKIILAQKYLNQSEIKQQVAEMTRNIRDSITLPNVFNSAWKFRLEKKGSNPRRISQVSLAMCHQILSQIPV